MRDEKLHADWARSTFPSQNVQSTPRSDNFWKFEIVHADVAGVKTYKTHQGQTTFGRPDVEKVQAVAARSTFPSQDVHKLQVLSLLLRLSEVDFADR